jgi:prolipoprotein diacylglyceryltransferase
VTNILIISVLGTFYVGLFAWAFRVLPREGWQILSAVPLARQTNGQWTGFNLTYYGLFTATGVTVAAAVVCVLMAALAVPIALTAMLIVILLALCVPAAKIVARLVEDKTNTFTIGGAVFVGVVLAPWVILGINLAAGTQPAADEIPFVPTLAILAIAYAFGEGTGRLACISFGCCYGKPLTSVAPWMSRLFGTYHFVFAGPTKKAAYEGGLEATPVIPIQGVTAIIFVGTGLLGLTLFLHGHDVAAFVSTWLMTQLWRAASELLRADYRGDGTISSYQVLALMGALYGLGIVLALPDHLTPAPDIWKGLRILWNPAVILALQLVWVVIFLYTGRSKVTVSTLSVSVVRDQV